MRGPCRAGIRGIGRERPLVGPPRLPVLGPPGLLTRPPLRCAARTHPLPRRHNHAGRARRRPRIFLFDEATSALDNKTQQIVTDSVRKLEATRVVIAHRLSTVMHADTVVVL